MHNQDWVLFETYDDRISAEAMVSRLESEEVPTLMQKKLVAGIERGFKIMVPSSLLHRARWILQQSQFSESELNYLATGELSGDKKIDIDEKNED